MGYTILIVDDSAITRAMIRRTLVMAQIPLAQCLEAGDGKAGLEVLASAKVDLVLADLHMPNMTGVEMTRHILNNEATRNIPVIVVSAEPSAERLEALRQSGVRGCIRKPFTPEAIREVVNQVLGVVHA
jgi:two-component system chemotaxis response regulator CheY